jgi:hypothetical protein
VKQAEGWGSRGLVGVGGVHRQLGKGWVGWFIRRATWKNVTKKKKVGKCFYEGKSVGFIMAV